MLKQSFAFLTVLLSSNVLANDLTGCVYPAGLAPGINMKAYQLCSKQLNTCQKEGAFLNKDCVKKVMTIQACTQLQKIADHVQISPEMLSLKQYGSYKVVALNYPADGGQGYYIVSPQGCFVNTNIDPRSLDAKLKQKYSNTEFFTEASAPIYKQHGRFVSQIQVKKVCRACELIGTAQVLFDFSKSGKQMNASLLKFEPAS